MQRGGWASKGSSRAVGMRCVHGAAHDAPRVPAVRPCFPPVVLRVRPAGPAGVPSLQGGGGRPRRRAPCLPLGLSYLYAVRVIKPTPIGTNAVVVLLSLAAACADARRGAAAACGARIATARAVCRSHAFWAQATCTDGAPAVTAICSRLSTGSTGWMQLHNLQIAIQTSQQCACAVTRA